ncbi:MAG: VCBS repeat-containing protein [Sandaracinus sp.]
MVVESAGSLGAGVYLDGPTGSLSSGARWPRLYAGYGREAVGVLDLDANGMLDVAIPDDLHSRVLVYLVRRDGVDAPIVLAVASNGAAIPAASVAGAGDVNEDGYDDLVVGGVGAMELYFGGPRGVSTRAARFERPEGYGASVAGGADVNGDGHVDVVVGANDEHAIYLHLGDGHGLGPPQRLDASGRQMGDDVAIVGDVDHDGLADVVSSGFGGNGGWLFFGARGAGLRTPPTSLAVLDEESGFSLYVDAVGDVDGDGFDDIVCGGYAANGAYLFRGAATGPSAEPQRIPPLYPDQPWMYRARGVGDVNGDARPDVALDNTMAPRTLLFGSASGLASSGPQLVSRPDSTAPPPYVPPPPVHFPPVRVSCTSDADCARVPRRDDQCCPLCAQYFGARRDYLDEVNALCDAHLGACAISCAEGPPPEPVCEHGRCNLRPH